MKIKEIIVVEGKEDSVKVKQAVQADTIETNGSAINKRILKQIKHAQEKRGVIIFTDPDYPGKHIRHVISEAVPSCKHAFLTRDEAKSEKSHTSLGIEHASISAIKQALEVVYNVMEDQKSHITKDDLFAYGLIGCSGAQDLRNKLGELLCIGHTNGKQLLKRLAMFQITTSQLEQAMDHIQREEKDGF